MRHRFLGSSALLAASMLATPTVAFAADDSLPGVDANHRIVKALPPEPDGAPPAGPRTFKLGNVEVEVRGKIIVEFGFGKQPRRRK